MPKKNSIFSGKPPRNQQTYEQFWSDYLAKKAANAPQVEEARRKRSAMGIIQYANRLADAKTDVVYKGRTYSPESNRMRYLMEQLDKGERDRLRRGIYDDSKTQRQIAERMLGEDLTDEELDTIKKEAEDIYNQTNRDQAIKLGPPKRKPPKPKI